MALAGPASAVITRHPEPFSPLTGAASGVTFAEYNQSGVAVDEATGNVFVTDAENGIVILGGEGGAPDGLASPFLVAETNYFQSAVGERAFLTYDNSASGPSKGTLYAYDYLTEGIKRYEREGASEQYVEVSGGEIPMSGCGEVTGGGIDSAGDLYFGCGGLDKLYELSPAGVVLHEYGLAVTGMARPSQVAVDSAGDVFVQADLGALYKFPVNLEGEIEPLRYEQITGGVGQVGGVAYEPEANEIIVGEAGRVEEYNATTLAKIGEFGAETLRYEYKGEPHPIQVERVAVNVATHRVYLTSYYDAGSEVGVRVFGPDVVEPTLRATAASSITGTKAILNGSINPEGIEVTECFFEYGETSKYGDTVPCEGLVATNDESQPVSANITGLSPNGATYHYRVVATNENGTERSAEKTLATAGTVVTEAATGVSAESATLNGYVRPEGLQYSGCAFEYKLVTEASYSAAPCSPVAAEIEPDFTAHAVSARLAGLQPDSSYEVRLLATNGEGDRHGEVVSFTTTGPPQISEMRARDATETSVILEAKINPSGYGTSYRFEWGLTASYGSKVPVEFEPSIGSGREPVLVTAELSGLTPGTAYHYRLVASNTLGGKSTAESAQTAETLDSCGLPGGRCLEMVSPKSDELGPAAVVGRFVAGQQLRYQAAEAPGLLDYAMEAGLPEATRGTEVLYQGARGGEGWHSTQMSPGISIRDEKTELPSIPNRTMGVSPDLSCEVVESAQPLTADPVALMEIEAGGADLYRHNPDGSYTLISDLPPEVLSGTGGHEYELVGMSNDCGKVVFESVNAYSGVRALKNTHDDYLYEWTAEGGIRGVGYVPSSGGEELTEASGGVIEQGTYEDQYHAVSGDGSRVFFSALRLTGKNAGEVGKTGVFVRIDGAHTKDVSLSETSTPDTGATYQGATADGSRAYFIANAGLASEASPAGQDLYEYNLQTETLADLSAGREDPAQVQALVGLAADGSHVYFTARGQLVPGQGATLAENEVANTFSLYDATGGAVHYVGAVAGEYEQREVVSLEDQMGGDDTSRVSSDGRYLLFESSLDLTGYESEGEREVYLYDADGGSDSLICVSCRQDGKPPSAALIKHAGGAGSYHLDPGGETNSLYQPQSLVVRGGQPEVYFVSRESLAGGAIEDAWSLYEWAHGQVFRIASEAPGTVIRQGNVANADMRFIGASAEGGDLYFFDGAALNWEDPQGRPAAWDAKAGGGFAEPAPAHSCEAGSEGSQGCQSPASQPPALGTPGSLSFSGPGNATPTQGGLTTKPGKPKHHGKQKRKKKKKKSKHTNKSEGKQMRRASGRRGAAK
ncbi:MAG TPA: hypothetical protein VGF95_03815 [Solirubrobacteraceae bacterium]|jgi:hypothetical protein